MRVLALGASVLLLLGCRAGRIDKRLAEVRPKTDAKLAAMAAVNAQLPTLPPLKKDTIAYQGPALLVSGITYDGDTFVMSERQLAEVSGKDPGPWKHPEAIWIEPWITPLKQMREPGDSVYWASFDDADVDRFARPLLQLEHLVVVRTLEYVEPADAEGGFISGRYLGEAHLFALTGNKYLGGFRFGATSSEKVKVQYGRDDSSEKQLKDIDSTVKADLKGQALTELEARLKALAER